MNIEQKAMLNIIARHVNCDVGAIDVSASLADNDIDSLRFIVIVLDIEQKLQRTVFDISNIGKLKTVADMLALAAVAHEA